MTGSFRALVYEWETEIEQETEEHNARVEYQVTLPACCTERYENLSALIH